MTNPITDATFPVPTLPKPGQQRAFWRAPASASALAWSIARAADAHRGPLLAIARDNHAAHQLESDLRTLLGDDATLPVVPFPDWETLPYDQFSPHPEIVSQRLAALHRLPVLERGIVIVPVQTLLQRLPPLRYVVGNTFDVRVGQKLDFDAEKRRLESAGYRNVPQVMDPGDFAVRGGLLDVYPMGADEPYRVELFDDAIDSIRVFDPDRSMSSMMINTRLSCAASVLESFRKAFSSDGLSGKKRLANAEEPATKAPQPLAVAMATALPSTGPA
jgi:transcription-repair coupling factor (superfamily II helicase)